MFFRSPVVLKLLFILLSPAAALARLGESVGECQARYEGMENMAASFEPSISAQVKGLKEFGVEFYRARVSDFLLDMYFEKGVCVWISYRSLNQPSISQSQLEALLEKNSPDKSFGILDRRSTNAKRGEKDWETSPDWSQEPLLHFLEDEETAWVDNPRAAKILAYYRTNSSGQEAENLLTLISSRHRDAFGGRSVYSQPDELCIMDYSAVTSLLDRAQAVETDEEKTTEEFQQRQELKAIDGL